MASNGGGGNQDVQSLQRLVALQHSYINDLEKKMQSGAPAPSSGAPVTRSQGQEPGPRSGNRDSDGLRDGVRERGEYEPQLMLASLLGTPTDTTDPATLDASLTQFLSPQREEQPLKRVVTKGRQPHNYSHGHKGSAGGRNRTTAVRAQQNDHHHHASSVVVAGKPRKGLYSFPRAQKPGGKIKKQKEVVNAVVANRRGARVRNQFQSQPQSPDTHNHHHHCRPVSYTHLTLPTIYSV